MGVRDVIYQSRNEVRKELKPLVVYDHLGRKQLVIPYRDSQIVS